MSKQGKSMSSPRGMYSYKSNPMKQPRRVPEGLGGSAYSPDRSKVVAMSKEAIRKHESQRGGPSA